MPLSELHKKKRVKNFAVLGAIIVWSVFIFYIAVIRMGS